MSSKDGITWTTRSPAEPNAWYSVCYGNGLFVAVAASGTNRVMTAETIRELVDPSSIVPTREVTVSVMDMTVTVQGVTIFYGNPHIFKMPVCECGILVTPSGGAFGNTFTPSARLEPTGGNDYVVVLAPGLDYDLFFYGMGGL